jgi:RecG-like helicase
MAGTRQSGMPEFRVANLIEDSRMLALAQQEAEKWAQNSGERERLIRAMSARSRIGPAGFVTVG